MFDEGEDIDHLIDWSTAKVVGIKATAKSTKRINIEFPAAMVGLLDDHAAKRGVTRQALIKMWLADRLEAAG